MAKTVAEGKDEGGLWGYLDGFGDSIAEFTGSVVEKIDNDLINDYIRDKKNIPTRAEKVADKTIAPQSSTLSGTNDNNMTIQSNLAMYAKNNPILVGGGALLSVFALVLLVRK